MDIENILTSNNITAEKLNLTSNDFVHLHVHSSYSILDGVCKPKDLAKKAKKLGMSSIAITDHNHLGGTIAFQDACNDEGVKPLLGYEGYYTLDTKIEKLTAEERHKKALLDAIEAGVDIKDKEILLNDIDKLNKNTITKLYKNNLELVKDYEYDTKQYHILYLAMNQIGWNNLIRLQSESSSICTYNGRFIADMNLIRKYSEGVICTAACVGSYPADMIYKGKRDKAIEYILAMKEIFNDRFYLEIQPTEIEKQAVTNEFYMKISKEYNIKTIATTDVHYLNREDWDDHDTYMCIATKKLKTDTDRMIYDNQYWLKSIEEMVETFENQITHFYEGTKEEEWISQYRDFYVNAIKETVNVAARIEKDILIGSKTWLYPTVEIPKGLTLDDVLIHKAYNGLYKYLNDNSDLDKDTYMNRLAYELEVITKKKYSGYFLMVEEYVNWGNSINPETGEPNCVTGPGRGSADGSLVLYVLGISLIDPIKNNLMFERFLSIDRTSAPDVDVDHDYDNRHLMIKHFEETYGKPKVSHIGTWAVLSVLSGIKDFARVLNVPFADANNLTKELQKIMDKPQAKFKDYDALKESSPDSYKTFQKLEKKFPEVFRLTRKFEGCCRQYGVHASGVLVMPIDVNDMFPTRMDTKTGDIVTLYTGTELEAKSAIKQDILGLKSLTVIKNALKHIDSIDNPGTHMTFEELYRRADVNDSKVYDMICAKNVNGVFQIESNMFKGLIDLIQPRNINDIAALVALG